MREIVIAPEAEAQIRVIDAWWRANRESSPNLFAEELAAAIATIAAAPEVGRKVAHPEVPGVRRILLRATRHHAYYVAGTDRIAVVAVWGSIQGVGPNLSHVR